MVRWWCSRVSATGKNMVRRGQRQSAECPRCQHAEEDNEHVLRCQHPDVQKMWQEELDALSVWLCEQGTCFPVREALILGLGAWYRGEMPTLPEDFTATEVAAAFHTQTEIGWRSLLEGCPSKLWAEIQQTFFDSHKLRRTGRTWVNKLLKRLVDFSFSLWDHRNKVDKAAETSVQERELNQQIDEEFRVGFYGLTRRINRHTRSVLKQKPLAIRKAWLRNVRVERAAMQRKRERNRAPDWALYTIGYWTWSIEGKPAVPTEALCAKYEQYADKWRNLGQDTGTSEQSNEEYYGVRITRRGMN